MTQCFSPQEKTMKLGTILILSLLCLSNERKTRTHATVWESNNLISGSEKRSAKISASKNTSNTKPVQEKSSKTQPEMSKNSVLLGAKQMIMITGKDTLERTFVCLDSKTKCMLTDLDKYFFSLGEYENPAQSCSHITENNNRAKNGYYWIDSDDMDNKSKVWCDFTTGTGGFMLIGYANSPVSWDFSSNPETVSPYENPHWSTSFGKLKITEFRVQVSSSANMKDTKADWLYHLSSPRLLSKLFTNNPKNGGCSMYYPGIGKVEYVEDLISGVVATKNFHCSHFGPSYPSTLGWQKMNECFITPCKQGFAYLRGDLTRYDDFGSFSYSTLTYTSGINDRSTAFVGCEHGKCCACYGPTGEKGNFCSPPCKAINGGTVLKNAHVWFWVRATLPREPVWNRCIEFARKTSTDRMETHFINGKTGFTTKGTCARNGVPNKLHGVVKINNGENLKDLPSVEGLLSYSNDTKKLYIFFGEKWNAITTDVQVTKINKKLSSRIQAHKKERSRLFRELKSKVNEFVAKLTDLEKKLEKSNEEYIPNSCKDIIISNPNSTSGMYWIKSIHSVDRSPFGVYCDMITEGGGWTLVYSYRFTNFGNFSSKKNLVTPRPNWSVHKSSVKESTSPPLNELSTGAVDYNLWHKIGQNFMLKSNINDAIVCKPVAGSLVMRRNGYINCKNIKNIATNCTGTLPIKIVWHKYGPHLSTSSVLYDFERNSRHHWLAPEPCGKPMLVYRKRIFNPGGAIFIR